MKLSEPVTITPRLMPGVRVGKAFISIGYSPRPGTEGRTRYQYFIDLGRYTYKEDDLQSGAGGGDLNDGLESLLSFLGAFAESVSYFDRTGRGENISLFPKKLREWASENSDEFSYLEEEIRENKPIEE